MSEPKHSPWRQPRRWLPIAAALFVILSLAGYRIASNSQAKRNLEALRSKGLPTSPEDLDKWYSFVPGEENAALAFLEAYALYTAPLKTNDPNEMKDLRLKLGEPLPNGLDGVLERLLTDNREAIDQVHKAAELSRSRYPIDLTRGFATLLPHLAQLRPLAQLMKWEAIWQSTHGNKEQALKAIRSGFAVAASLENEPLLVSELVRIAILNQALVALERVVTEQQLTDGELAALIQFLTRAEEQGRKSIQRAISGERAGGTSIFKMDYRTFDAIGGGGGGGDNFPDFLKVFIFEARRGLGVNDRDMAFYLGIMTKYEAASQKEYPEMIRDTTAIADEIQREFGRHRFRYMISGMMLPALEKSTSREALVAGQLRCARMALAIERYRAKHGEVPSLEALVPAWLNELPRDPVSGDPLEYEKLSRGYRIVSGAATDRKTEGGTKKNEAEVAFTVLR